MKAVFFDLDETLLDRFEALKKFAFWQVNKMLSNEVSNIEEFVERFIALDAKGSTWKDKVYETLVSEYSISEITPDQLLNDYVINFSNFCQERPFASEAVKKISEMGKKLALVSNGRSPFQENNFDALAFSHLFDEVVISGAIGFSKPDKNIFNITCNRLGIIPSEVAFIGDNPINDIEGANELGMYTIFIPGPFGDSCDQADAICSDLRDLAEIVHNAS